MNSVLGPSGCICPDDKYVKWEDFYVAISSTLGVPSVRKVLNQFGKTALAAVNQSKVAVVCLQFVPMDGKGLSVTCLTAVRGRVR